jgi:7-cyano-7-deazaguanine synthase
MCARFSIRHETIPLPWLARITGTALVGRRKPLPHIKPAELDDPVAAGRSALRVWVPNRNGVFLAVAAAYAEALGAGRVVAGFNAEEAATFPDNSEEFAQATTRSLRFSTRNAVRVKSYTFRLRKPAIVALGLKIGAPMDLVWPCYEGGKKLCGRCESCLRFLRAIREARRENWFAANCRYMPKQRLSHG